MVTTPFFRRILPWIFAVGFFIAAPALVFYTAGYRWNPKKYKIERNGTLILDSRPTKARILLNGTPTDETTPITLQNVAPGRYSIRIEKDGFHSWEKRLEVLAEYVTFANDVWLWKKSEPALTPFEYASHIEASPNDQNLAIIQQRGASSTVTVWGPDTEPRTFALPTAVSKESSVFWSQDSRALFVESRTDLTKQAWLINIRGENGAIPLPSGIYRWNGNALEGTSGHAKITIRPSDGAIERVPFAPGIVDRYGDILLQQTTGTDALVLLQENGRRRGIILPTGAWRVHAIHNDRVVLRNGSDWLSINPDEQLPHAVRANGDALRPYTERRSTAYLAVHGNEIWRWNTDNEPELLSREGQRVRDAVWHPSGRNIALGLDTDVVMMNLDPRDGNIRTTLAQFDEVFDIAILENILYITATKNGWSGLWELELE